jgi:hypothetical protein
MLSPKKSQALASAVRLRTVVRVCSFQLLRFGFGFLEIQLGPPSTAVSADWIRDER